MKAKFHILSETADYVLINDDYDGSCFTVTNDAENVVEILYNEYNIQNKRIFYRDTDNSLDELLHENNKFTGFKTGHEPFDELEIYDY
jgi:hypothetical protein